MLVVPPGHPLAQEGAPTAERIGEEPFIFPRYPIGDAAHHARMGERSRYQADLAAAHELDRGDQAGRYPWARRDAAVGTGREPGGGEWDADRHPPAGAGVEAVHLPLLSQGTVDIAAGEGDVGHAAAVRDARQAGGAVVAGSCNVQERKRMSEGDSGCKRGHSSREQ